MFALLYAPDWNGFSLGFQGGKNTHKEKSHSYHKEMNTLNEDKPIETKTIRREKANQRRKGKKGGIYMSKPNKSDIQAI